MSGVRCIEKPATAGKNLQCRMFRCDPNSLHDPNSCPACSSELGFALAWNFEIHRDGVIDRRQGLGELDIDDRPDDLHNFAFIHVVNSARIPERAENP